MIRACDATRDSSELIRFSTIKESYGIINTSDFTSSGKFTCEDSGVYILMLIIFSNNVGDDVFIYKNGIIIQNLELRLPNNNNYYHTITGSLALSLNIGDTINVKAPSIQLVRSSYTCISIIKVQ